MTAPQGGGSVYMAYDANDEPLYIGITHRSLERLQEHQRSNLWWSLATSIRLIHLDSYDACKVLEKELIAKHQPPWNGLPSQQVVDRGMVVGDTISAREVAVNWSDLVSTVSYTHRKVTLTRHRKPVAVMVDMEEYERLGLPDETRVNVMKTPQGRLGDVVDQVRVHHRAFVFYRYGKALAALVHVDSYQDVDQSVA